MKRWILLLLLAVLSLSAYSKGNTRFASADSSDLAPTALCQNVTVQFSPGLCSATLDPLTVDNGSFDVVGISNYSLSQTTFSTNNLGYNTVILTVTNINGGTSTCTATVFVEDAEAPTLTCGIGGGIISGPNNSFDNDVILANDPSQCGAYYEYVDDAVDNCPGVSITQILGLASGSVFPIGTTLNTMIATDASGNTSSCSFEVMVIDVEQPTVVCPNNFFVNPDEGSCGALVGFQVSGTDNCGPVSVTSIPAANSVFPIGTTTVMASGTDGAGNVATCAFTVTVIDNGTPQLNLLVANANCVGGNDGAIQLNVTGGTSPFVFAWSNGAASQDISNLSAGTYCVTVNDQCGNNTFSCVTVGESDTVAPEITCPPNQVGSNYSAPIATDNCGIPVINQLSGIPSGGILALGAMVTNVFQATDASGNTATCAFVVSLPSRGALDPQPVLDTVCQVSDTMFLIREDDLSSVVNKCYGLGGIQVPCNPNIALRWGYMIMEQGYFNDTSYLNYNFTLAAGWYANQVNWNEASQGSFVFDQNGIPIVTNDWPDLTLAPAANRWQIRVNLETVPYPCFDLALRVNVIKLNIFGATVNGSQTVLWSENDNWNTPGHPANSSSPWLMHFCPLGCMEVATVDTSFESLAVAACPTCPSLNCTTLHPTPTDSGTISYAWSTGYGTQNIQVCPTATTDYMVTISVEGVPRHIVIYHVDVIGSPAPANDLACQAQPIQVGVPQSFDNSCAQVEAGEPSPPGFSCNNQTDWCDPTIDHTVWFSFQAPASGCASIVVENDTSVCNGPHNFQMAVWKGLDCSGFTDFALLAANDDGGPNQTPVITGIQCLIPGQTYFVQVDGYNGFQGLGNITLTECSGSPFVPAFTTVPADSNHLVQACLNQTIYFQDSSIGVANWLWEFGDGFVSTASSPNHAYQLPGNYVATLTASDFCGNTSVLTVEVVVSADPGPRIFCPSVICEGDTTWYFTDAFCNSYQWVVNGGNIVSTATNNDSIQVAWGSGTNGFGSIELSVPNCGGLCENPSYTLVPILPSVLPISGPVQACAGNAGFYTVPISGATVYTWSVDQFGTIVSGQGSHQVEILWDGNGAGISNIHVIFENELAGCEGIGDLAVQVMQRFHVNGGNTVACENDTLSAPFHSAEILSSASVLCNWSVTASTGTVLNNVQLNSSSFNYGFFAGAGQYTITAIPVNGGYCNGSASAVVQVTATPPTPAPIVGNVLVCPSTSHHYSTASTGYALDWSILGGTITQMSGNGVDVTWDANGPYELAVSHLSAENPTCNSQPTLLSISAFPAVSAPQISGPSTLCLGENGSYSIPLPLLQNASYSWSIDPPQLGTIVGSTSGNVLSVNWIENNNVAFNANILLTIGRCEDTTLQFPVFLDAQPTPSISGPTTTCIGTNATFNVGVPNQGSYFWNFGDGDTLTTNGAANHSFTTAGTYTVTLTVTNGSGCLGTTSFNIMVNGIPSLPIISGNADVCSLGASNYSFAPSLGGVTYAWSLSPAIGSIVSTGTNSIAVTWNGVTTTTVANVELQVSSQCLSTTVSYPVSVHPLPNPIVTGPSSICAGETAVFIDNATSGTVFWNFGDGSVSTVRNPSHTFAAPGNYTVTLTVTDLQNCTAMTTANIVVHPNPNPVIAGPFTTCAGTNATFISSGAQGILWNFGDGGTANTSTATHNFTVPGNYVVTLTTTDGNGCNAITSQPIAVNPVPTVPTLSGFTAVCAGTSTAYSFTPNSPELSYSWTVNPPNVSNSSPAQNAPIGTFAWNPVSIPTSATVELNVASTCLTTAVAYPIVVHPVPTPVIGGPIEICVGSPAAFTDNVSGQSVSWAFGDGGTSSNHNPVHTYATAGTYTVTLATTNLAGCTATSTFQIFANPIPALPVVTGPDTACARSTTVYTFSPSNLDATYAWTVSPPLAASLINGANSPTLHVLWNFQQVTTTVEVILTMSSNCDTAVIHYPVTINPLPAAGTITASAICEGQSTMIGLAPVPGSSYAWAPSLGLSSTNISNPSASPSVTTVYNVTETILATGCARSNPATVAVNPNPAADAGLDVSICEGNLATLGASQVPGNTYFWSPSTSLNNANSSNPVTSASVTTTYVLTETTTATQCSTSNSVIVTVNPTPNPILGFTTPICLGQISQMSVSGGNVWAWQFGDGGSSNLQNPMHSFDSIGTQTITVTVTDGQGCAANTSALVNVNPVPEAQIQAAGPTSYCIGDTISTSLQQNLSGNSYVFSWQPGNFTGNPLIVSSTGNYSLVIENEFNCRDTSNIIEISQRACQCPCGGNFPICDPCPCPCGGTFPNCDPCATCNPETFTLGFDTTYSGCATLSFTEFWSSNVTNLGWNFGDGSTSLSSNPSHSYAAPGIYTVTLNGIVPGNQSPGGGQCLVDVAVAHSITIPLIADFFTQFECNGLNQIETQFHDISLFYVGNTIQQWEWDFGDGSPHSFSPSPIHVYASSGTYNATLIIKSNVTGAICSVTLPVLVPAPSVATFANPSPVCQGVQVPFLSSSTGQINRYIWDFDLSDVGSPTSNFVNPSYTYGVSGPINVQLNVEDVYGCESTVTQVITVLASANGNITSNSLAFCTGDSVLLSAPSGLSWLWSPGGQTAQSLTISSPGNYEVQVWLANGCSYQTASVYVSENPLPTANVGTNGVVCLGESVQLGTAGIAGHSYIWTPSTGLSDPQTGNPLGQPSASTIYTLTETINATGCSATQTLPIIVNPIPAAITGENDTICNGESVQLGAPHILGHTYQWSPSLGLNSATFADPNASPMQSTVYHLTESITATGCTMENDVVLVVNPLPLANVGNPIAVCLGGSAVLGSSAIGGRTYQWSPASGLSSEFVSNPLVTPNGTTSYTLVETNNATGCVDSNTVIATVNPLPEANPGENATVCLGESLTLGVAAVSGNSYAWFPTTHLTNSTISNPVASPLTSTTYTLIETVLATGCSRAQNVVVTVNPQPIGNAGNATSVCAGDSISIGTVPILGNTYTWFPATGLSNSNLANPKASPSSTTTYTLHETNTMSGCEKISSVTVTVNPLPLIHAGFNISICAGSNTTLGSSSASGNSYSWSPSTALNSAVVANPTASPSATTTYQLVQTVNATGCQATENVTVTVNPRPAAFAGSDAAVCLGGTTNLGTAAVNGNTYAWNPSLGLSDANISNPVANPTVTSTYTLTETILGTGCQNTETILLTVNPLPPANVGNDFDICDGETAMLGGPNTSGNAYLWSPSTGLSAANVSNPIVSPNSSTTYSLIETIVATGCSQTQSVNVTVHANPDAFVGNPTTICAGDTIQLGDAAVPGNSYIWATSLGLSDANLANPFAYPSSTTVYSLTETNIANGCTTTNTVEVTVNPQPNSNVIGDQVYCVGDTIILSTTLGYDYEWEFDDFPVDGNFQSLGETNAVIMIAANLGNAGNYSVLVTDQQNGCSIRSLPHPVIVNERPDEPEIEANGTGVLCNDQTWTLSVIDALSGINYSWSTGQIGTSILAANAQTYWVVATNGLGCSTASEVIEVLPSPTISGLPTGCYEHCATLAPLELFGPVGFASYEWFQEPNHSLISTNPDISIDSSGSYRLRVTNVEGCPALSEFIQITFIDCCTSLAAISSTVDVTCFGNNDGAATVVTSGGLEPYHYLWDSGDTTSTIQNLWAGIYLIDVIDQNNCLFHLEDTIYEPTELILTQVENEILCYGDSAMVEISASGGTLPYSGTGSYLFAAGPYNITVIDSQGCTAIIEGEMNQPEPLFINVTAGTIQCQGDSTNVLVNVSGGVAPYVGTGTFVVSHGMHIYHVSDENGCTVTDSVAIAPISTLEAVAQVGTIACRGGSTTIGVTAIGGLPPYLGLITDTVFAGTYLYEVEDANGCTDTIVVEVTEPDAISINVAAEEILCHGDTVNVMVTASGGTGAFLGTGTFSVSAGLHSFTVTDANNCASTSNITLIEPTSLTGLATFDPLLCHGDSTTVNIIAIGGTPPYIGVGAFTAAAGIHQYLLQDANLCQFSLTVNIASPTPIVAQATAEPLSCGDSSTTVTVSAIGGTEPYIGTGIFAAVAGTHQYVVTDANGCFTTVILTIAAPTANIALSAINTNYGCNHNISCNGGCDGGIDLSVSGGLPPYTYLWSNQAATQDLQGLCSGGYSVTVTDVQGCTTIDSFMLTQPSPLILNLTSPTDACGYHVSTCCATGNGGSGSGSDHGSAQDGSQEGSDSGSGSEGSGSGHRNHSFGHGSGSGSGLEGSGSGSNSNVNCGQSTSLGNNGSHGSGSSDGGSGGNGSTHRGGQSIAAANISALNGQFGHNGSNASGSGSGSSDHENRPPCGRDGAVNLSVLGGCAPYSYHWSTNNVGNTNHPVGLSAGLHFVTVTDGNGCTAIGSITLTQASLLSLTATSQNISCFGLQNGTATAAVSGGCGPYTYSWCNGATSSTISGLGVGNYSVTVTDGYGCQAETTVSIAQPSRLFVDAGLNTNVYPAYAPRSCTTLHGNVHGGTPAYTMSWISSNGNMIGMGLNATICPTVTSVYRLRATDAQGCIAWDSVAVCPISVSCGSNMVRICHNAPGHHGASQNQCVPASTVASHLAHGDRLGTCGASANCAFPSYHNGSGGSGSGHKSGDQPESSDGNNFQLQAYPNPTVGKLDVLLTCNSCDANGLYHLRLTDLAGKVLLNQPFAMNRGLGATQLNLTHLASGTYLLSVDGFGFNKIVQRVVKD